MNTNNLPQKPDNAVWNSENNVWELGIKNDQGKNIGEWKYWGFPTNHFQELSLFSENGLLLEFTIFHPDGTLARKGAYDDDPWGGQKGVFIFQKSINETNQNNELFEKYDNNIFKITSEYQSKIKVIRFFTMSGIEVDEKGFEVQVEILDVLDYSKNKDFEKLKNSWYLILEKLKGIEHQPYFIHLDDKLSENDSEVDAIKYMEEFLGQSLPVDYKNLILNKGIIRIDYDNYNGIKSINPEKHIINDEKVGMDFWNSFLYPNETLRFMPEIIETITDDYQNQRTAKLLEKAVVFMQAKGDANYYFFVQNENDEVVMMYLNGDRDGSLKEVANNFKDFLEYYVKTALFL